MDAEKLGRRIKEARLAKKMTQTEVVGSFITRNMLSRIESGAATPSMKTLAYLSNVLEISLAELMADSQKGNVEVLLSAKAALKAKCFDEVISLIGEPDEQDEFFDEYCALLAHAHYGTAKSRDGSIQNARLAAYYATLGIYADNEIKINSVLLLDSKLGH